MVSFNDLPLEIIASIAELDYESFNKIRSVNSNFREYSNECMNKYKDKFSKKIIEHGSLSTTIKYYILPNGAKHGSYKEWYDNGQVKERCTYKDGQINGQSETWYDNGQIKTRYTYKNGILDGPFEHYYNNGRLLDRSVYKNGEINGLYEHFAYIDGIMCVKTTVKNGGIHSSYEMYDYNEQIREISTYKYCHIDRSFKEICGNGQ